MVVILRLDFYLSSNLLLLSEKFEVLDFGGTSRGRFEISDGNLTKQVQRILLTE